MSSILSDRSVVTIFATAPAGLGHLRVTHALYHGLPKDVTPILLGAQDRSVSSLYRFISIHPFTRQLMEWLQNGPAEELFTVGYRNYLLANNKLLYQQLTTILSERLVVPKTVLVVATHFALAHQLAEIKEKVEKDTGIKLFIALQVTDDSPQRIWYVPGVDLIFVPSFYTRDKLVEYGHKAGLAPVHFTVAAYPVSPLLATHLSDSAFEERQRQLEPKAYRPIHVAVPISGAAVGTMFSRILMEHANYLSPRFHFHVISRQAPYTKPMLTALQSQQYITLETSTDDRGVVAKYEDVYKNNTIALEITKPSEQAFKTLIPPTARGGVIMLFSNPVGRQEYDNLHFMRRHHLIPSKSDQEALFNAAKKTKPQPFSATQLSQWRGLVLPHNPLFAAEFITWCLTQGIFKHMLNYKLHQTNVEVHPEGVTRFWQKVTHEFEKVVRK